MIEPPETVHHAGHHKSSMRWFDLMMAIGVLLVSAGSLYVAFHTGHTMEKLVKQNERLVHAQSTPVLRFSHGNLNDRGESALDFEVTNVGSGVARIISMSVIYERQSFPTVLDFARSLGNGGGDRFFWTTADIAQTTMPPGEVRAALSWKRPETPGARAQWERLDQARFQARASACYCSVFDECWVSNMEADIPRPVAACVAPAARSVVERN